MLKATKHYANKHMIKPIVKGFLSSKGGTVYGAQAYNEYLPPPLDKHTKDWDVYHPKPKKMAHALEKHLDKKFGGDYFRVKKAKYPNTHKVVSNVTGETVVDFTKPEGKVASRMAIDGVKYARMKYLKKKLLAQLRNPAAKFRRKKDLETLKRIQVFEKHYGRVD